jgi:hypothetical protein
MQPHGSGIFNFLNKSKGISLVSMKCNRFGR